MGGRFSFAVVGRNEADTVAVALGHALEAAADGDRVWFVDSASSDDSAAIAARLGAEVVRAPAGKGRAMQVAIERCTEGHLVFLDADYEWSDQNIPALLRAAVVATDADMVVGAYSEPLRRRVVTPHVYLPLVGALAPEALGPIDVPLSGFRALRASVARLPLPDGYGVETHLNLEAVLGGATVTSTPVGEFRGNLKGYRNIVAILDGVAAAVLDVAEGHGRIDADERPAWEAWVAAVRAVVADQPPPGADDTDFLDRLAVASARPLPARAPTSGA